jgi:Glycosyl transferase family 2
VTSIALCGIVKDEIHAIVEWLAHYKALGFTDFLIYDNESTDGTSDVLRALDAAGELIHIEWPHDVGLRPQRLAYEHARRHSEVDWLAFFDADEFLVLHADSRIDSFLSRFDPDVSAIAINWTVFGSGGQKHYRPTPVIERFTDALPEGAKLHLTVKSIARRATLKGNWVHRVKIGSGRYVTPSGRNVSFLSSRAAREQDVTVAAIHHYAIKSIEEFAIKRVRGDANTHSHAQRLARLDRGFASNDAGGVRNDDLARTSGPMRAEAMRLCQILRASGLDFPVWPFIEAEDP